MFVAVIAVVFVLLGALLLWSFVPAMAGRPRSAPAEKAHVVVTMEKDNIGNQLFQMAHAVAAAHRTYMARHRRPSAVFRRAVSSSWQV